MLTRANLVPLFSLNPGVTLAAIRAAEAASGLRLPADHVALLQMTNGLTASGRLALLELEAIGPRNADYEVQFYLPGYVMIGDDGGGTAILMKQDGTAVFEVGMGTMDEETMALSAASLAELLIDLQGRTLAER